MVCFSFSWRRNRLSNHSAEHLAKHWVRICRAERVKLACKRQATKIFTQSVNTPIPLPKNPRSSERGFFYPSLRLGISSPREVRCISSRAASRPCISSRVSVYLSCGLMIYSQKTRYTLAFVRMIYNGVAIDFSVRICYNTIGGGDYLPKNYLLGYSEELATKLEIL